MAAAPRLTEAVILVKPQFEAGREYVGKGGIVRDPEAHRLATGKVAECAQSLGWQVAGTIASPITGMEGNRARLHVHGLRRRRVFCGHLPPDDARLLQRAALPGSGLGHSWRRRRTGHAQDGWLAAIHADHVHHHGHRHAGQCGGSPFAGFFSKDEILWKAYSSPSGSWVYWLIGVITAFITSFYMFRLMYMTFGGDDYRGTDGQGLRAGHAASHGNAAHGHDSHGHGEPHECPGSCWLRWWFWRFYRWSEVTESADGSSISWHPCFSLAPRLNSLAKLAARPPGSLPRNC